MTEHHRRRRVHRCSSVLAALVRAIDPTALDTLVFLGDCFDRGPDSRGVLEQVSALAERCTLVPLLGNEEMLGQVINPLPAPAASHIWTRQIPSVGRPSMPRRCSAERRAEYQRSPVRQGA